MGSRKLSQAENARPIDGNGLAIAGSSKDYTQRPEPKRSIDYSSPSAASPNKRGSKGFIVNKDMTQNKAANGRMATIETDEGGSQYRNDTL